MNDEYVAVTYYLAVALPAYNRDRLTLEQQKYADEQRQRGASATAAAAKETNRQSSLDAVSERRP